MYTTDLDRLHKVTTKEATYRGAGKTYAKCHEVAGLLEVTEVRYILCMITLQRDIDYILPMLRDVLLEHDIAITGRINHTIRIGEREIRFIPESDFDYRTRGMTNCAVVRMRHWD